MSKEVIKNGEGIIPEGTKVISAETFAACTDLTRIVIPDSVTEIGDFAFSGCTNLASIKIPYSVKKIGFSAFAGCHSKEVAMALNTPVHAPNHDFSF